MSGSSASIRDGHLVGECRVLRAVHLDRLYPLGPRHSLSAAQGRPRHQPRRLRPGEPFRQGAGQRAGNTIRATSCSRSTRTRFINSRWRSCSSTSGRACACCRGATASTASSPSWSTSRANATTAGSGPRSATIWQPRSTDGVRAFYPFFPEGQLVRVHFIIGRDEGETPHVDRATLEHAVEAIVRSWTDALGEALARRTPAARGAGAVRRAIARPSRSTIARPIRRRLAVADIAIDRGADRRTSARR